MSTSDVLGVRPDNGVESAATCRRIAGLETELFLSRDANPCPERTLLGSDPKKCDESVAANQLK